MDEDAWFKPPPAPPQPPGLAEVLHDVPGPLFAVLDGGQFEDLPAALKAAGLPAR